MNTNKAAFWAALFCFFKLLRLNRVDYYIQFDLGVFDIVIIGAGPAGSTAAWHLAGKGFKIALLDKKSFPRDKICGDALSGNTIFELKKLEEKGLDLSFFEATEKAYPVDGLSFFSPKGHRLNLFLSDEQKFTEGNLKYPGYVSKRIDFDNFLLAPLRKSENVFVFENCEVKQMDFLKEKVEIICADRKIEAKLVLGADGANSILARKLWRDKINRKHFSAGLRQYYRNVKFEGDIPLIELHFLPDILPGYFWIFPMADNLANVGIGMLSSEIEKRSINLKEVMEDIIERHPRLSSRFDQAEALELPKGFGLPLGSRKSKVSGERFLLLGDAASLIDPFTGEGIGFAMTSGRLAAKFILSKWGHHDFRNNQDYDEMLWKKIGGEMLIAYRIQRLLRFPWLFDWVVKKANSSPTIWNLLNRMVWRPAERRKLSNPLFYFKVFRKS
ncbi:geranylgeranyl reductase family protein [Cecembia rubra]|uniref:geranylgeranyl reductase family protein n=1 Tax=Cecembia rubra TaxID=1485585 RepID=UPI002714DDCE|nr:geranylgeranyl reductase family protein [Cecembia rubra]